AWRMGQGGFRVDWDAAQGNQLTFQGDAYDGRIGQNGPDDIRANGGNVLRRWTRVISEPSDLKLQAYYDRTHRRIPNSFTQDLGTFDLDFQYHMQLASIHDLVWGAGFRQVDDKIANTPANAFLPPHVTRDLYS